ncbi:MAG: hypothetical protein IGS03_08685 [Candidatus Sericytochromatia bacterium]|nr:hypothetical protein [Candidatus Sericytochromatia bacterium]
MSSLLSGISLISPQQLFGGLVTAQQQPPAPVPSRPSPLPAPPPVLAESLSLRSPAAQASSVPVLDFVTPASQPAGQQLNLPPRPAGALSGSEFLASVQGLNFNQREAAIQAEILRGNVPQHLRQLQPVNLSATGPDGQALQATAYVTPDYLAIGSDDDYVLVPMSPLTAQAIADQSQTTLPTRKLVDAIYQQAEIQLRPSPQTPGPQMMSTDYYARHNTTIAGQREQAGHQPGQLTAGHKKDVVITNRLNQKPKSVAIYGWHQPNGKAIQPLSTLHENTYADYSHGVRLIGPEITINGVSHSTVSVLQDRQLSALLSDEGPLSNTRATR